MYFYRFYIIANCRSLTDEDGGKEYEYRLKAPATDKHSSLSTSQFQDQHVSQLLYVKCILIKYANDNYS